MAKTPTTPGDGTPAAETTVKTRVEPQLTAVGNTVAMPEKTSKRGVATIYPFAQLTAVGMSFGVKNKDATSLRAVVSNANRKGVEPKKDEAGNILYVMNDIKDPATGAVTGQVPTSTPITEVVRHFFVVDTDPATDPDGAKARVFRDK